MKEQKQPKPSSFSLVDFKMPRFEFNEPEKPEGSLELGFFPTGEYNPELSEFLLRLEFKAFEFDSKIKDEVARVTVLMESKFRFSEKTSFEEIPAYFYQNSIAIIFPYIRAFVSNITLQSNIVTPIIIPTYNLTSLGDVLKQSTTVVEV